MPYSFLTLIGRDPPALHLRSYNIVHLCVLIVGQCMRKHRCPGGVKVARFPGMSEVSGWIPVSGLCCSLLIFCCIYLVFTMLFIFVKRMCSYAWCSVHGVKVARFPGMSEVSGSIPVSGLCFLLIFAVFTLCLPCYSPLLSACTVKRGAPSTASCLTHS